MKVREETHSSAPYNPSGDLTVLFPDTWYLDFIDDKHRRTYKKYGPEHHPEQNGFVDA